MGEVQLREGLLYGRRLQYSEGLLYGACCWSTDGYPGTVRVSIMELAAGWGASFEHSSKLIEHPPHE